MAIRVRRLPLRKWLAFVLTERVYPSRWQDRLFRGHIRVGPITVYGANAMHWAINVWALGHFWCWHPTTQTYGGYWPWYFYISKDATPQSACFRKGREPE